MVKIKLNIKDGRKAIEEFENYIKNNNINKKEMNKKELKENHINDFILTKQNQLKEKSYNYKELCQNEDYIFNYIYDKY